MTTSPTSIEFATAARALGRSARRLGLDAPTFRSPPRISGAQRSIRRGAGGWTTVSVQLTGRPLGAVVADMVEGVIVANEITGAAATRVRTTLWEAVSARLTAPSRAA